MLSAMLPCVSHLLWRGARSGPLLVLLAVAGSSILLAQSPPATAPAGHIAGIDRAVDAAIAAGQTPGAVVLVGRGARLLHFQA